MPVAVAEFKKAFKADKGEELYQQLLDKAEADMRLTEAPAEGLFRVPAFKEVVKAHRKTLSALEKSIGQAEMLAVTDRDTATKALKKIIDSLKELRGKLLPEIDKQYKARRDAVAKNVATFEKHPQKDALAAEIKAARDGLKYAEELFKKPEYWGSMKQLDETDDLATAGNSCDLSQPDKKAVFEAIKKGGDPAKALAAAAVTSAKGSATAEDAVAVAQEAAKLPTDVLKRLKSSGATVVAARGNVPDVIPSLKGKHPNGWPPKLSWDNVPGVYDPSSNQIVACTRKDGKDRKVLETGKVIRVKGKKVSHGSFSVVLHEAGHGLDFNGYNDGTKEISPELSSTTLFTGRRNKDVAAKKIKSPEHDYYLQKSPWGERETFAESTARYFGGDGTFAGDSGWPDTSAFWAGKPWGIGSV